MRKRKLSPNRLLHQYQIVLFASLIKVVFNKQYCIVKVHVYQWYGYPWASTLKVLKARLKAKARE